MGEAIPAYLLSDLDGGCAKHGGQVQVDWFYTYGGSLTTPGRIESVRWSVLSDGRHVSQMAVTRFHEVISQFANYGRLPNSSRPVQPLKGRVVQLGARHFRRDETRNPVVFFTHAPSRQPIREEVL